MSNPNHDSVGWSDAVRLRIRGSGGVELAGDAYGDPAARPVVLFHGGGQTRHSWGRTARALGAAGWYAVTMDLRGHGESGWAGEGNYRLSDFAGDVLAVRDHLGRAPVLIGASLGGVSALAATARDPGVALGLVLVDVSPFIQPAGTSRITGFMNARPDGFASIDEAADAVAAYLPHRPRPRDTSGLRKNLRLVDGRWHWHWDPAFLAPAREGTRRDTLMDRPALQAAATALRVPTLLVRGGQSDVLSEKDARHFLDLVPHTEYVDVAGAHHMVAGDDNAVFDGAVEDFLRRRIQPRLRLARAVG